MGKSSSMPARRSSGRITRFAQDHKPLGRFWRVVEAERAATNRPNVSALR